MMPIPGRHPGRLRLNGRQRGVAGYLFAVLLSVVLTSFTVTSLGIDWQLRRQAEDRRLLGQARALVIGWLASRGPEPGWTGALLDTATGLGAGPLAWRRLGLVLPDLEAARHQVPHLLLAPGLESDPCSDPAQCLASGPWLRVVDREGRLESERVAFALTLPGATDRTDSDRGVDGLRSDRPLAWVTIDQLRQELARRRPRPEAH